MKQNFKIDYRSQTADYYTTFSWTEQSKNIAARNRELLRSIADQATATISNQARQKGADALRGANVNTIA
jgi:predicted transcriptional regulator